MASDIEETVLGELNRLAVAYETIDIDPTLADTAAFCAHYGYPLEESANCIVVASRGDAPVFAACMSLAHTKLDVNKRVRKLLGVRKLSFASADQTRAVTGMMIGGVTPFGLPNVRPTRNIDGEPQRPEPGTLPLWIDARVADRDRVIVGGGSRRLKLSVPPAALTAIGGEFVEDLAVAIND